MKRHEELLNDRRKELQSHLRLISELNDAAIARVRIANLERVEIEHVEILKSGFLVHLYNVVEAVMGVILVELKKTTVQYPLAKWSTLVRREWVRVGAGIEYGLASEQRLLQTSNIVDEAITGSAKGEFQFTSSAGTWSDEEIERISRRLGCTLQIDLEVRKRACGVHFENNQAPMKFVRHKRNQLAHGVENFATSAKSLSPSDLERLYESVVAYISDVAVSYTRYLDNRAFLQMNAAA